MAEAGYSFSLTTFSPSGKLLQIEHALRAVQSGKTSLGIQGASQRGSAAACGHRCGRPFHSPMLACSHQRRCDCDREEAAVAISGRGLAPENSAVHGQHWCVCTPCRPLSRTHARLTCAIQSAGVIYSGMGPDFRVLVRKGQKKAQQYYLQYGVRARVRLRAQLRAVRHVRRVARTAR